MADQIAAKLVQKSVKNAMSGQVRPVSAARLLLAR
jgi:hypothetical protein